MSYLRFIAVVVIVAAFVESVYDTGWWRGVLYERQGCAVNVETAIGLLKNRNLLSENPKPTP